MNSGDLWEQQQEETKQQWKKMTEQLDEAWGAVARQEETIKSCRKIIDGQDNLIKKQRQEILKLNTVIAEARKVLGE